MGLTSRRETTKADAQGACVMSIDMSDYVKCTLTVEVIP